MQAPVTDCTQSLTDFRSPDIVDFSMRICQKKMTADPSECPHVRSTDPSSKTSSSHDGTEVGGDLGEATAGCSADDPNKTDVLPVPVPPPPQFLNSTPHLPSKEVQQPLQMTTTTPSASAKMMSPASNCLKGEEDGEMDFLNVTDDLAMQFQLLPEDPDTDSSHNVHLSINDPLSDDASAEHSSGRTPTCECDFQRDSSFLEIPEKPGCTQEPPTSYLSFRAVAEVPYTASVGLRHGSYGTFYLKKDEMLSSPKEDRHELLGLLNLGQNTPTSTPVSDLPVQISDGLCQSAGGGNLCTVQQSLDLLVTLSRLQL